MNLLEDKNPQFAQPMRITEQIWPKDAVPVVSICCITYNHEKFIRDCFEGFLTQETTFPVEVLIHDDASIDGTADIIREYEAEYPYIIKPICQTENQYSKGVKPNITFNFPRAKGKYIALCEGDDYWTDPVKLQKQIEIMEGNSELAGCAHQATVIYDDLRKERHDFRGSIPELVTLDQLLHNRKFHTASFLFRSEIALNHPLPSNVTAGDRTLFLLIASFGNIRFINESMACYRKHSGGISSWVTPELMEKDLSIADWISRINPNFPKYRYLSFVHYTVIAYPRYISIRKLVKNYILYVIFSFSIYPKNIKPVILFTLRDLPKVVKEKSYWFTRPY